jgi:deazaflavin-dependent oxidoreductase (nitroreductase family)
MAMNGMTQEQTLGFNRDIIDEFRSNGGKCGGRFEGNPMLLLTTTGARSGRTLIFPLTFHAMGDQMIVMASAGGHPKHPSWFHNLVAFPDVTVEVGNETFEATANQMHGEVRTEAFDSMRAAMPRFGGYQESVDRLIPMFAITRAPTVT